MKGLRDPKNEGALPTDKAFGMFFSVLFFFGSLATLALLDSPWLLGVLTLCFVTFLLLSLFSPSSLAPLNLGWAWVGMSIGRVVNPVILAVIFFGVFSPVALIMRMTGRDELRLKNPAKDGSYWLEPAQLQRDEDFFTRQF